MLCNKQTKLNLAILLMAAALCMAGVSYAAPIGTAFTYQGQLADANSPAEGLYDFEFAVFDALVGGSQQGSTLSEDGKDVTDGYFTVTLDFGAGLFTGDARWLQIAVRTAGAQNFTALSPRQELTPAPYALYAQTAGGDGDWRVSGNNMYAIPSGTVSVSGTVMASRAHDAVGPGLKVSRSFAPPISGSTWMNIDSTSIDTYWQSFQTTGTALKLNSNSTGAVILAEGGGNVFLAGGGGNVGIGTTPQAKLHIGGTAGVDGIMFPDNTLQTTAAPATAAVPIGSVIDWWRPNDTFPVPDGYQICDGSVVNDAQSPFNGQTLPDIRTRFVMGTNVIGQIGQSGGSPQHNHTISGSVNSTVVTMGASDSNYYAGPGITVNLELAQTDHRHTTNSHNHGLSSLGSSSQFHLPPYVMLLKIMRIR